MLVSAGVNIGAAPQEPSNTCPSWGTPIHVHVHGIRNVQGTVKVVLYGPNPQDFLVKGKKTDREREPAEEGSMTLCVAAPDKGRYAVVVYHDENDNHKFHRNWIGLPIEGFGVSNDPTLFLAPPNFEEAAFEVNGDLTNVEVEIKY
jgi:uncharacterized protein (DUF2141 family)